MQTVVVGQRGFLSYEFMFDYPQGNSWMATYFAWIEDLDPPETRIFTVKVSHSQEHNGLTINVAEDEVNIVSMRQGISTY
jgi:hypothetical protein